MGWMRVVGAVVRRPSLWRTAIVAMTRTVSPGWWRRAPFLPVPSGDYLRFRAVTQYGDEMARPLPHDVVNYLAWVRQWDRA